MITHHPETELLLDYSAGCLPEPVSLVVAAHACLCRACRDEVDRMEAVGGALLHELEPTAVGEDSLAATLARLDLPEPRPNDRLEPALDAETRALIPAPVRPYLPGNIRDLRWRWQGPTLHEARLNLQRPGYRTSLFRLRPGKAPPAHTHGGNEYILVLDGSFEEDGEIYGVGDFAHADAAKTHVQTADAEEGCVCLTVLDAPVRLPGIAGSLVNPFLRF
jgi:putative transcriptional regulator